jgi:hypothetical protein
LKALTLYSCAYRKIPRQPKRWSYLSRAILLLSFALVLAVCLWLSLRSGRLFDRSSGPINPASSLYYVAPNGNDNNPGTKTHPLRTIQKAVDLAQAGEWCMCERGSIEK